MYYVKCLIKATAYVHVDFVLCTCIKLDNMILLSRSNSEQIATFAFHLPDDMAFNGRHNSAQPVCEWLSEIR